MKLSKYSLPMIGVLALIPILYLGLHNDPSTLPSQYIGKSAPDFELPSVKNPQRRIGTADIVGEIAIVNIWATWCAGCRSEHPFLMGLFEQQRLPIFAVNWRDNRADAIRWLQQLGDPYVASAYDEDGRVGIDWGVYGAPETFLLNAGGQVVFRYPGPLNEAVWEKEFEPRIAELKK